MRGRGSPMEGDSPMPCKYNLRKRGCDPLKPPPPPDADPPPPEKDQAVEPTTPKRLLRRRRVSSSTEEESNCTATMLSEAKECPMEGVRKYNLRKRGFAPLLDHLKTPPPPPPPIPNAHPLPSSPPPPPPEKDIPFGCVRTEGGDSFEEKVKEKMIPIPDDEGSTSKRKADPESSPPTIMNRRSTSEAGRCGRSRPLCIRQMKSDEGMEMVVGENNEDDSTLSLVRTESSKNSKVCEVEDDNGAGDTKGEVVTRNKVRETLRLFQAICRKLLQEEESKVKVPGENVNGFRIDLSASKLMKEKQMWVNTGKAILGVVPGVEVGDEFQYRVELSIVGIHRLFQGGIDYLKKGEEVLATSIVASGGYGYDDETDSSDVLIYSGAGGTGGGKGEKKVEDQKLERGNLALKNSIHARSPVRVIRGFKELKRETRPKVVTNYTYDGLYTVEKYWHEQGKRGCSVFKFQLRRMLGQPELAIKEVKKSKKSRVREGTVMDDISMGEEKLPICVVNTVDGELPPPFKYTTKAIHHPWYNLSSPRGCGCINGCSDSNHCACAVKNGGEIPFNFNGAIVEAKPLVYECGPSCKCPPSCHNRVSQHGMKFLLEVFKTQSRGWGVRSLASIPSGSFICEYTGELLEEIEAEQRTGNDEYLFDIGHNYSDKSLWEGLSTLIPDLQTSVACDVVDDVGFTIDAAKHGNVGRFINHSCSPNLYAQNVLYDHDDKRMPHIMLFAAENIPPLQELTYDYNYRIDQVRDSDGNIKRKDCYCGSQECTGRLY